MDADEAEVKRQMARESLAVYARLAHPKFDNPRHVARICRELQLVEAGINDRVIFAMPPRHGKSLTISEIFPAYFMGRDPSRNVIFATYAQNLANRFGRIVRDRVASDVHRWVFPECQLNPRSSARESFSLIDGGEYNALGVDGPATGKGAELFLIDDPFKDDKQADSELIRDNVFSWYQAITQTRLHNGGRIVLVHTRWHEDDLIGRLLRDHADDGWRVISMPAICEDESDADDWRKPGDALWPERFPLSDLIRKKVAVGKRVWAALYQQKPYDDSGTVFKLEWIDKNQQFVDFDHRASNRYIVIDTASVQTADADFTVIWVIAANCDHHFYAVDLVRDKLTMVQRWDEIFRLARKWRPLRVGIEQVGAQDEVEYARERMRRENYHFNIVGLRSTVKKERRIEALQGLFEERRFHYPRELHRTCWDQKEVDLIAAFRDEYMKFPAVRHDDMLDALAWIKHPDMNVVFPMSQEEEELDSGSSSGGGYSPTSWMAV